MRRTFSLIIIFLFLAQAAFAQQGNPILHGDPAQGDHDAALVYASLAQKAMDEGRWEEALAVLEEGADFAGASSDLSCLLAKARLRLNKPRGAVLAALSRAIAADWWTGYFPEDAWRLAAEVLIDLRFYQAALNALSQAGENVDTACLRLRALQRNEAQFRRAMRDALDRYPRDPRPVRILLDALNSKTTPNATDREFLALALKRLYVLLQDDPSLAWRAAPFIADIDQARRLVAAYRAGSAVGDALPDPASLPVSLYLGLLPEAEALEELFTPPAGEELQLDKALIEAVWAALRRREDRERLEARLASYNGIITIDEDRDGIYESSCRYFHGLPVDSRYDRDQDGLADIVLLFSAGEPREAFVAALPDSASPVLLGPPEGQPAPAWEGGAFRLPLADEDLSIVHVRYERYPAVLDMTLEGVRYLPRPLSFFYTPCKFDDFLGSGLLLPKWQADVPAPSRRTMAMAALVVERPSREFSGAVEQVELAEGIPTSAREYLGGRLVSETFFAHGLPLRQSIDLDLDGRLETLRYFRAPPAGETDAPLDYALDFDYTESDWDGDGVYESRQ